MRSTRNALEEVESNVDESMGQRRHARTPQLSPVSSAKDVGRRPLRSFGSVEVDRIIPDPNQPRTEFDTVEISRLADSIRSHGQLHPIRVRWNESADKWIIVTGERRWRATVSAGMPTIDCYFVEGKPSDAQLREQQLVENILREDLKPLEEAKAYQALMQLNDWNGKQIAEALRISTSRVSRSLALLDLPEEVRAKVENGTLAKSSAYELSKLEDQDSTIALAKEAAAGQLPHREAVTKVQKRRGKTTEKKSAGTRQTFFAENGIRVTVSCPDDANYFSIEQALQEAIEEVRLRIDNNIRL